MSSQGWLVRTVVQLLALAILACSGLHAAAQVPAAVGIPGNYQSEAGCAGDWDPACAATQLAYDANGDIWRNTFNVTPGGAWALAAIVGRSDPSLPFALHAGFLVGLCFVATSFGINYLFAGRSLKLWLIDAGYHILQFTLYGLVLGLF